MRSRASYSAPRPTGEVAERLGDGSRGSYRLHPPLLRALGMRDKISLGPWPRLPRPVRAAPAARHQVDPFRPRPVRRVECARVTECREAVERLLAGLDATTMDQAVELAALPTSSAATRTSSRPAPPRTETVCVRPNGLFGRTPSRTPVRRR
ncbi:DUF6537 domain-containing protein [Streptomyces sp. NPDC052693]|uniref:DUF6537 domain-containing protein n=1 Tax=Streptomyces sp. NPDC052693 TaxID=3155814 RepID=UPI0034242229